MARCVARASTPWMKSAHKIRRVGMQDLLTRQGSFAVSAIACRESELTKPCQGGTPKPTQRKGVEQMNKLQGEKAVITGGTSGIGPATAKLFVNKGAHVVIMGRRKKELEEAAQQIGQDVIPIKGDLSDLADIDRLYETIKPNNPIDIVFATAGIIEGFPLSSSTEEQFDKHFDTNVKGVPYTVQKSRTVAHHVRVDSAKGEL